MDDKSTDRIVWTFFAVILWLAAFFVVLVTNPTEGLAVLLGSLLLLAVFLKTRSWRKKRNKRARL